LQILSRGGRFCEFAKNWLLPLLLGFIIGLAIFLLVNVYGLLNSASLLIVNRSPLLLLSSAIVALFGGYLMVRLLAENKECGYATDLLIERYHLRSGFLSLRDTISKTLASALTIGFGGSAGLEGPSLLLGGGLHLLLESWGWIKRMLRNCLCAVQQQASQPLSKPLNGDIVRAGDTLQKRRRNRSFYSGIYHLYYSLFHICHNPWDGNYFPKPNPSYAHSSYSYASYSPRNSSSACCFGFHRSF